MQPLVVSPGTTVVAGMTPGGTGQFAVAITNPNSSPVQLSSLVVGPGSLARFAVGGADAPAITKTVAGTSFSITGGPFLIPAGGTIQYVSAPDALTLSASASDAYQNATFDISLSTTGAAA